MEKKCSNCKNERTDLLKCSICKTTFYCNKDCQKSDWPNHRQTCQKPIEKNKIDDYEI